MAGSGCANVEATSNNSAHASSTSSTGGAGLVRGGGIALITDGAAGTAEAGTRAAGLSAAGAGVKGKFSCCGGETSLVSTFIEGLFRTG